MNKRAFTLSLIIAVMAMVMVQTYIQGEKDKLIAEHGKEVTVIVAKVDIQELDIIDDTMVASRPVPAKYVPPSSFKQVKDVILKIARVPIKKGEVITAPRITNPGAKTGLARQVAKEKRAVSITVSSGQSVSGLIRPGDRVDLLAKIDFAGGRPDLTRVRTVLQDVMVLSTGLKITNSLPLLNRRDGNNVRQVKLSEYTNYNSVTLEVDSFQAQQIILLENLGAKPYLILRNNGDKERRKISSTKIFDLLGEDATEAKAYFQSQQGNNPRRR